MSKFEVSKAEGQAVDGTGGGGASFHLGEPPPLQGQEKTASNSGEHGVRASFLRWTSQLSV